MPRGVTGLSMTFTPGSVLSLCPKILAPNGPTRAPPSGCRHRRLRDGRFVEVLQQEAVDQPVGPGAVGGRVRHRQVAADRAQVEALVLLVAAAQRRAGEVPGEAEQPAALLGIDADAQQVLVDQWPQLAVGEG